MVQNKSRIIQWFKIISSFTLVYLLFDEIAWERILEVWDRFPVWVLPPAMLLLIASRLAAALRLRILLQGRPESWSWREHLALQFRSQYYALLVPAGIGGDAFKAWNLRMQGLGSWSQLSRLLIADRLSGLASLLVLAFILLLAAGGTLPLDGGLDTGATWCLIGVGFVAYRLIMGRLTGSIANAWSLEGWAFGLQALQTLSAACLMFGLGLSAHGLQAMALFLLSSIAAMLPLTFAGFGSREWVLLKGADLFHLPGEDLLLLGLLFFCLQVVTTFLGLLFLPWLKSNEDHSPSR